MESVIKKSAINNYNFTINNEYVGAWIDSDVNPEIMTFTVPETGIYLLYAAPTINKTDSYGQPINIFLSVNGNTKNRRMVQVSSGSEIRVQSSIADIRQLQKGDIVSVSISSDIKRNIRILEAINNYILRLA